ncbi:unnamed protein product, partial [Prorocentrum cordatum]
VRGAVGRHGAALEGHSRRLRAEGARLRALVPVLAAELQAERAAAPPLHEVVSPRGGPPAELLQLRAQVAELRAAATAAAGEEAPDEAELSLREEVRALREAAASGRQRLEEAEAAAAAQAAELRASETRAAAPRSVAEAERVRAGVRPVEPPAPPGESAALLVESELQAEWRAAAEALQHAEWLCAELARLRQAPSGSGGAQPSPPRPRQPPPPVLPLPPALAQPAAATREARCEAERSSGAPPPTLSPPLPDLPLADSAPRTPPSALLDGLQTPTPTTPPPLGEQFRRWKEEYAALKRSVNAEAARRSPPRAPPWPGGCPNGRAANGCHGRLGEGPLAARGRGAEGAGALPLAGAEAAACWSGAG